MIKKQEAITETLSNSSKEKNLCPHGHSGKKPLDCPFCQKIEIPHLNRRLADSEQKELLALIARVKEILKNPIELRKAIQEDYEPPAFTTIRSLIAVLKSISTNHPMTGNDPDYLPGKVLGHSDEAANRAVEMYAKSVLYGLEADEESIMEDLSRGQADLEPYLAWKESVKQKKSAG